MPEKNTLLLTGATGYIGSALVKELLLKKQWTEEIGQLILYVRSKEKAYQMLQPYLQNSQIPVQILEGCMEELTDDFEVGSVDYIIHCASPTASAYMISNPVETADSIVLGTKNILSFARKHSIKSMVYLSSMEVYGIVPDREMLRTEEELGEVKLNRKRSCYPLGKRMAEHYCYSYYKEYGVPVKTARLAQVFGSGVNVQDNRVYMQFARAVKEKRDIVLKTEGLSIGNYCAEQDAVNAIFTILYKGENGEAYNVVNEENTMSIKEMAQLVATDVAGGLIGVRIEPEDREKSGYAPDTKLRLSGEKLRKLGWYPTRSLKQMYEDLLQEIV